VNRALIADHQGLARMGLKHLLRGLWAGAELDEAASLSEALELMSAQAYDLLLVDPSLPGFDELHSLEALCDQFPEVKIAIVSGSEKRDDILAAIIAGARGYIPKPLPERQIARAIELVMQGAIYVPDALGKRDRTASASATSASGPNALTPRQRAVFAELLTGKSSKQIAQSLGIAEGTVKIHLAAIYRVLGVRSRAEAIARSNPRRLALGRY
jgi:DNA-binding NarL/FixJ family response regulator